MLSVFILHDGFCTMDPALLLRRGLEKLKQRFMEEGWVE
jgi:hypothetical protein